MDTVQEVVKQPAVQNEPKKDEAKKDGECPKNWTKIYYDCWWSQPLIEFTISKRKFATIITFLIVIALVVLVIYGFATFENKAYDPYGMGIRHYVSRDDTGAVESSLEERQVNGKQLKLEPVVEQLTSNPEPPNFSEYYNIEANIKDGTVMIDRENFENSGLNLEKLVEANKGL